MVLPADIASTLTLPFSIKRVRRISQRHRQHLPSLPCARQYMGAGMILAGARYGKISSHSSVLETGLDVEAHITGIRRVLLIAGTNGGQRTPSGAANVAKHGAVLDKISGQLDAVLDQVAVATDAALDVAIEVVGVVGEREGELGALIDQSLPPLERSKLQNGPEKRCWSCIDAR